MARSKIYSLSCCLCFLSFSATLKPPYTLINYLMIPLHPPTKYYDNLHSTFPLFANFYFFPLLLFCSLHHHSNNTKEASLILLPPFLYLSLYNIWWWGYRLFTFKLFPSLLAFYKYLIQLTCSTASAWIIISWTTAPQCSSSARYSYFPAIRFCS